MAKRKFASIPVPTADLNGLYETCMAIKQQLEALTGQGGSIHARAPLIHVHVSMPTAATDGDFWLCEGGTSTTLNVLVAGQWRIVGTLS